MAYAAATAKHQIHSTLFLVPLHILLFGILYLCNPLISKQMLKRDHFYVETEEQKVENCSLVFASKSLN